MATPKEELSIKMLSTFDMTKIIWTFKKIMVEMAQIHYISRKKSHIAKTFL
jgi:hypothetical protein